MASGRQVEYSLNLKSNAYSTLMADSAAANKFDASMWQVQKTLASFGLGLGATFMIDAAKEWTQAAADYEVALLRIKNASDKDLGIKNQLLIKDLVKEFKLDIEDATNAYGNFLFKTKNVNVSSDIKNNLFREIEAVGKIGGLTDEQMKSTTFQIATLLGEGVLDGRHLRQLSQVHPNLMPFIADELGLKNKEKDAYVTLLKGEDEDGTKLEKLSLLITKSLTKLGIGSIDVIIPAMNKYFDSIKGGLAETLTTLNSQINDLHNTWFTFKSDFVLEHKQDLVDFFGELKEGIKWLTDNRAEIESTAKSIYDILKLYLEWRVALFALETPMMLIQSYNKLLIDSQSELNKTLSFYATGGVSSKTALATKEQTVSFAGLNSEITLLNANLAEMIALMTSAATASGSLTMLTDAEMQAMSAENLLLGSRITNELGVDATIGMAGKAGAIGGSMMINAIGQVAMPVAIMWMAGTVLDQLFPSKGLSKESGTGFFHPINNAMFELSSQSKEREMARMGYINTGDWDFPKWELKSDYDAKWKHADDVRKAEDQWKDYLTGSSSYTVKANEYQKSDYLQQEYENGNQGFFKKQDSSDINFLNSGQGSGGSGSGDGGEAADYLRSMGLLPLGSKDSNSVQEALDWHRGMQLGLDSLGINKSLYEKYIPDTTKKVNPHIKEVAPHHLRGNSSNYFTVNIHGGVNGMVNPVYNEVNDSTMKDVENTVGSFMTKNFLQIINDVQVMKSGH